MKKLIKSIIYFCLRLKIKFLYPREILLFNKARLYRFRFIYAKQSNDALESSGIGILMWGGVID